MNIFIQVVLLIVGIALLIKGADFFVDGSSAIARRLHIPALIIGLTLVSIGTSLPEASVSINASIKDMSDMSFGNVIGSNIFNVLVVIGLCAIITPSVVSKDILRFDIPIYFGIIIILSLFGFAITLNEIDRIESAVLFAIFILYILFIIFRAKKEVKNQTLTELSLEEEHILEKERPVWLAILFTILGMAGVVGGGVLTVNAAEKLALEMGMSELLVGLTVVAIGTSLPELVTSLVAARKGQNDIAVGNAIGSCLFNIVFILGFSGMINPTAVLSTSWVDILIMFIAALLIFVFAFKSSKINRWQGGLMILIYASYMTYIILRDFVGIGA